MVKDPYAPTTDIVNPWNTAVVSSDTPVPPMWRLVADTPPPADIAAPWTTDGIIAEQIRQRAIAHQAEIAQDPTPPPPTPTAPRQDPFWLQHPLSAPPPGFTGVWSPVDEQLRKNAIAQAETAQHQPMTDTAPRIPSEYQARCNRCEAWFSAAEIYEHTATCVYKSPPGPVNVPARAPNIGTFPIAAPRPPVDGMIEDLFTYVPPVTAIHGAMLDINAAAKALAYVIWTHCPRGVPRVDVIDMLRTVVIAAIAIVE